MGFSMSDVSKKVWKFIVDRKYTFMILSCFFFSWAFDIEPFNDLTDLNSFLLIVVSLCGFSLLIDSYFKDIKSGFLSSDYLTYFYIFSFSLNLLYYCITVGVIMSLHFLSPVNSIVFSVFLSYLTEFQIIARFSFFILFTTAIMLLLFAVLENNNFGSFRFLIIYIYGSISFYFFFSLYFIIVKNLTSIRKAYLYLINNKKGQSFVYRKVSFDWHKVNSADYSLNMISLYFSTILVLFLFFIFFFSLIITLALLFSVLHVKGVFVFSNSDSKIVILLEKFMFFTYIKIFYFFAISYVFFTISPVSK